MTRHRGSRPAVVTLDEIYPERRRARHREVAAIGADIRTRIYQGQNQTWGARNTGADGLTPRQRRRVKHKANAGRA